MIKDVLYQSSVYCHYVALLPLLLPGSQLLSDVQTFLMLPCPYQLLILRFIVGTGCIQENNIDYDYSDLDYPVTRVNNVAACNTLCVQTTSCTHWSVRVTTDPWWCHLKTSDSGRVPKAGVISGNKCGMFYKP